MHTLDEDIFNIIRASSSSYIVDYLDRELRNKDVVFIDVSLVRTNYYNEFVRKISEAAQEMLLTLCEDDITRIDISFNVFLGGSNDGDRYTITKCRSENKMLVIVKTRYGFIFARGGVDVTEKVLGEVLNNIKSDIMIAEALAKLCSTKEC